LPLGLLEALLGHRTIDEMVHDVEIKLFLIAFIAKKANPFLAELKRMTYRQISPFLIFSGSS